MRLDGRVRFIGPVPSTLIRIICRLWRGATMNKKAFTLIELLVVIAIIAVLMAILMPALTLAKRKAAGITCMAGVKNLSVGWFMYMEGNDGKIMSADDDAATRTGEFWIGVPRKIDGTLCNITQIAEVTDEDEIRGIEVGVLFPYVKNPRAYHCPADKNISIYDKTTKFVSYGLAHCLNGRRQLDNKNQIKNFNEIRQPSRRYVFVESSESRNWNSSHHFIMGAPEYNNGGPWQWWGPLAINHGDSSTLGYCDGHAEIRKWRDRYTIERVDKLWETGATNYGKDSPPSGQVEDLEFMAEGWAFRYGRQ